MWKAARNTVRLTCSACRSVAHASCQARVSAPRVISSATPCPTGCRALSSSSTSSTAVTSTSSDGRFLTVAWQAGGESRYPFIYLRDNCTCSECFHELSSMRTVEIMADGIDADISPSGVESTATGVRITWPNGHVSDFTNAWLREHTLSTQPKDHGLGRFQRPAAQPWLASTFSPPVFGLDAMMSNENVQYDILDNLYKSGIVVVKGCGTEPMPNEVYEKLGMLQDTAFGLFWLVEARADPNNLAYSPKAFPLHTDLPYLKNTPGTLLLHCLRQAPTGGHTFLTDGFAVAAKLREENPLWYDLFSRVPVTWHQLGYDPTSDRHYHYEFAQPILNVDRHGELYKVCFSVAARGSFLSIKEDDVHDFYHGYLRWMQLCKSPEHRYEVRLEPGDMLIINDQRIAHGRDAISDTREKGRCLRGCYLSWDDVDSRFRHLYYKLKKA
ncbi:gamma-butyrobetaine dioxygenase-like [Sycon ciliatum]|uniref:gamma-butyrobetaine dioxygenase-like n=1 Tax=Sycon ciliatum TaxID=27933 RepID=UPI0031F64851